MSTGIKSHKRTRDVMTAVALLFIFQYCFAGPPFITDDPEPVPFRHWEYYISSINTFQSGIWSGTLPHFEINYGIAPGMMVHFLFPLNYSASIGKTFSYGYADTEFGAKLRFIHETDHYPQVGTFPVVQIPTIKNSEFSDNKIKIFIPVWAQKSWNRFTTYGGIGYLVNPGKGNKNSIFSGWEAQYDFSQAITLGGELYFQSANAVGGKPVIAFNAGGYINFSRKIHFIFSLGSNLVNENFFSSYAGLYITI